MTEAEIKLQDIVTVHLYDMTFGFFVDESHDRLFQSICGDGRFYEVLDREEETTGGVLYVQTNLPCDFALMDDDETYYFDIRKATPDEEDGYDKLYSPKKPQETFDEVAASLRADTMAHPLTYWQGREYARCNRLLKTARKKNKKRVKGTY